MNPLHKKTLLFACAAAVSVLPAYATDLLTNGSFTGTHGQLTVNTTLSGWTGGGKEGNFGSQTTPPVFVFNPGDTFVTGDAFMGSVGFYGTPSEPSGKNFVAADGDPAWAGSVSQTVAGLTVGHTYQLDFTWAGAQQQGFSGNTTESWQVSFGSDTQSTATVNTPSQTFVGWQTASMTFTATSTSQVLQFLAKGSPSGEPPWLLLSDASLQDTTVTPPTVPEPATITLVLSGAGMLTGLVRFKRRS